MTLANMEKFKRQPLNLRPEASDVVWSGVTLEQARKIALDDATKAASRGDAEGAAIATARAACLSKAIRVAPGATGVRWRERENRLYFIVPGVGHVQSIDPEAFIEEFASSGSEAEIFAMMDRGVSAVFDVITAWGWSAT